MKYSLLFSSNMLNENKMDMSKMESFFLLADMWVDVWLVVFYILSAFQPEFQATLILSDCCECLINKCK